MPNKNFTEVKFFLKNTATTAAFTTTFRGGSTPYPLANFSDLDATIGQYEVIAPTLLGAALFGSATANTDEVKSEISSVVNFSFNNETSAGYDIVAGDYLLFDNGTDGEANLQVLGKITSIDSNTIVTLDKVPTALSTSGSGGKNVYHFPKSVAGNAFAPGDNFYLVVKNPDYTTGNHDAVLNINTAVTTPTADVFAYSTNRTANPTYFKTIRISQNAVLDSGLTSVQIAAETNISSKITAISTYAQGSTSVGPINLDSIPYWSVYEVNPYGDTSSVFNKQTFYKVQIDESLPAKQITLVTGGE